MAWLNYHHLYYFWVTAREGSIQRACKQLLLAQPTISGQIRALEVALGEKLFTKVGRSLVLTEYGKLTYQYATRIFTLGKELTEALKGQLPDRPVELAVGLAGAIPKGLASYLLQASFTLPTPVRLICREGRLDHLIGDLVSHDLDVLLADGPLPPTVKVQAHSRLLCESGMSFLATKRLARRYRPGFPRSLENAPLLLPAATSAFRRSLDDWLTDQRIRPFVRGEFDDLSTSFWFGQAGLGLILASTGVEQEMGKRFQVEVVGRVQGIVLRIYAITMTAWLQHPVLEAIAEAAKKKFSEPTERTEPRS